MDFVMSFVILYNAIVVPYLACFESYMHVGFLVVNIVIDLLSIANTILHLLEPKMIGADIEKSRINRLLFYWKLLILDILSYATLYDWFLLDYPYLRVFRLIPFITLRFGDYYKTVESKSKANPIYLRIIKSVIYLSIIIHWFSCLYFLNLNLDHIYGNILIQVDTTDNMKYLIFMNLSEQLASYNVATRIRQYIGSFYFATVFLVGFATDVPQDEMGALYSIMNALFGVLFFAGIVGVVSNLVNQMNQQSAKFNRKLDNITGYLRFRKVSPLLISDSRNFLGIIQRANRELKSDDDILEDLELETKRKVSQFLHKDLVKKVPFMKDMDELFIQEICLYLQHTIILENYFAMQVGEVGREMFFLGKGSVDIVGPQGQIWASLSSGSFFGEVALIMNSKRMASVRTKEICEVFVLHKKDFDNVLSRFPEAKQKIQEEAEKRTQAAQKTAETKTRVQNKIQTMVKLMGGVKKATQEKQEQEKKVTSNVNEHASSSEPKNNTSPSEEKKEKPLSLITTHQKDENKEEQPTITMEINISAKKDEKKEFVTQKGSPVDTRSQTFSPYSPTSTKPLLADFEKHEETSSEAVETLLSQMGSAVSLPVANSAGMPITRRTISLSGLEDDLKSSNSDTLSADEIDLGDKF